MKWGELTDLVETLMDKHPKMQYEPTLLVLAVCETAAKQGCQPNAASVVRIFYRIKQRRRTGRFFH